MRADAVSVDALESRFAKFLELCCEHYIDAPQIWNLDETGGTAGKDFSSSGYAKRTTRKDCERDLKVPKFYRANLVTLMLVFNADGDTGPPLFVVNGTQTSYRMGPFWGVRLSCRRTTQCCHEMRSSSCALREVLKTATYSFSGSHCS